MGWERGYYYRVRKTNGRVVREYVGKGRIAALAARLDTAEREKRRQQAIALRHEKNDLEALDADLKALAEGCDLLARAALLAAGFHQHKRGEWRRRREQDSNASTGQTENA
jgi:hypothetical protein